MTIYYVDPTGGSDRNSGTSAGQAFKSASMVATVKLRPGDQVMLERGNVYTETLRLKGSGSEDAPIKIGAYGKGADPILSGAAGITGTGVSHVVVSGLTFANTGGNAIAATNVTDWVVDKVTVKNTGLSTGAGSIVFRDASDITITNSAFTGVQNDGIYATEVSDVTIKGNTFARLGGTKADGIQLTGATNVLIQDNRIDMASSPETTKGGIIVEDGANIRVIGNDIDGGSFGVHVMGKKVVIADNDISGQVKYDWSSAVLIAGSTAVSDYSITGNTLSDARYGVSLTGQSGTSTRRDDIRIIDNLFEDISGNALKVDQPSSGAFSNNILLDSAAITLRGLGVGSVIKQVGNVVQRSDVPVSDSAQDDLYTLRPGKTKMTGGLLENDLLVGSTPVLKVMGLLVEDEGIRLTGAYGVVDMEADGRFIYRLGKDAGAKIDAAKAAPIEHFTYQVTDALGTHSAELVIDLSQWDSVLL